MTSNAMSDHLKLQQMESTTPNQKQSKYTDDDGLDGLKDTVDTSTTTVTPTSASPTIAPAKEDEKEGEYDWIDIPEGLSIAPFRKWQIAQRISNVCCPHLLDIVQNEDGLSIYEVISFKLNHQTSNMEKIWYLFILLMTLSAQWWCTLYVVYELISTSDREWDYDGCNLSSEFDNYGLKVSAGLLSGVLAKYVVGKLQSLGDYGINVLICPAQFVFLPAFMSIKLVKLGYVLNYVNTCFLWLSTFLVIYFAETAIDVTGNAVLLWFLSELPYFIVSTGYYRDMEAMMTDSSGDVLDLEWNVHPRMNKWVRKCLKGVNRLVYITCSVAPFLILICH